MQELTTRYDSRKSFYGKAKVTENNELYSYDTLVAEIDRGQVILHPAWDYSPTTLRHVKEFLLQNGKLAGSKADIAARYAQINA